MHVCWWWWSQWSMNLPWIMYVCVCNTTKEKKEEENIIVCSIFLFNFNNWIQLKKENVERKANKDNKWILRFWVLYNKHDSSSSSCFLSTLQKMQLLLLLMMLQVDTMYPTQKSYKSIVNNWPSITTRPIQRERIHSQLKEFTNWPVHVNNNGWVC